MRRILERLPVQRIPPRVRPWAAGAGLLVIAFAIWQGGVAVFGGNKATAPASVPVMVAKAEARDVPLYLEGIGTVRAYNTVTVRPRVEGYLTDIVFQEGQDVAKGDVLAKIDPHPFQAALDSAQGRLAENQASLENAKRDLVRYQELGESGFAPRQRIDTQRATVDSLAAATRAAEGEVRRARVQLDYATIKAPIDGRTGIRQIDVGNVIKDDEENGLVVITQLQPISAVFTLPQKDIERVAGAKPETMKAIALGSDGTVLDEGVLELVDNAIDPATGTVRLKARFPNASQRLWPGEFITVRLQTGIARNAITVPSQAVQRGGQGPYTYVVNADDTAEVRTLQTGQVHAGQTLVTQGLNAGERVVIEGQLRLVSGTKVRPTNSERSDPRQNASDKPDEDTKRTIR